MWNKKESLKVDPSVNEILMYEKIKDIILVIKLVYLINSAITTVSFLKKIMLDR